MAELTLFRCSIAVCLFGTLTQSIKTRARKTKASTGHKLEMGQNQEQYQRRRQNLHKLEWETKLHKLDLETNYKEMIMVILIMER